MELMGMRKPVTSTSDACMWADGRCARTATLRVVRLRRLHCRIYRPPRYACMDPSLTGSLMMISPLRILTLYRQFGFVHTHALKWMEAPWLPKSESGTRSPAPHFRHRGNANSTLVAPSFNPPNHSLLLSADHDTILRASCEYPPLYPLHPKARLLRHHYTTQWSPHPNTCASRHRKSTNLLHNSGQIFSVK